MTPTQRRVLRYLVASGFASDKAVSRFLWGTPRQNSRARAVLGRLAAAGLVQSRPLAGNGERRSWEPTPAGIDAAGDS